MEFTSLLKVEEKDSIVEEQEKIQIATLSQQIAKNKDEIVKIEAESKKNVEARDQLNIKVKDAWQEIQKMKEQRDSINEKVKSLKEQREGMRTKNVEVSSKITERKEKVTELQSKLPRVSQHELQEELDAIEWKIQTTSLDLQEEKRLIERVKQLEILLSGYKKIDKQYQKIKELQNERKPFQTSADSLHQELTELAKKSQELHLEIISKIEQAKKDKAEADNHHEAYIQGKEQTNQLLVEIAVLTGQIKGLKTSIIERNNKIREKNQAEKAIAQAKMTEEKTKKKLNNENLRETLSSQAKDKLQRGEKLSWNEFQLLDDQTEDDPDQE